MRGESIVFVAAHPDDEVIGAGAHLATLVAKAPVVVHVTDGAPRDMGDARRHGFESRQAYAEARREEARAALAIAGVPPEQTVSLSVVDQEATDAAAFLARRLARLFETLGTTAVYTHPYEGGHPDHDGTALAVHAAVALLARKAGTTRLPVIHEFTSYHAHPHGLGMRTGIFLAPNQAAEGPAGEEGDEALLLSPGARAAKQQMLAAHRTQRALLAAFPVDVERVRRAPRYLFSTAPHAGKLHYEHFDWGYGGESWRALAARKLAEMGLPRGEPI